jgi:hypothetical protein
MKMRALQQLVKHSTFHTLSFLKLEDTLDPPFFGLIFSVEECAIFFHFQAAQDTDEF